MTESNGTLNPSRERRRKIRELREAAELRQLEYLDRRVQLQEHFNGGDWLGDYLEILRDRTGWERTGAVGKNSRRQGKNFPLFQSEHELNILRQPARIVTATNPYAIGLVNTLTGYVIGTGFTYQATIKHEERYPGMVDGLQRIIDEFLIRNQWGGNDNGEMRLADAYSDQGEQPSMEQEAHRRVTIDGEWICISTFNADGTTDCRVAEPEQLTEPVGTDFINDLDSDWKFGIKTPRNDAQRVMGYYLQWGDAPSEGREYTTNEVTHVRNNSWRTVKRGLTDFCFDTVDTFELANKLRGCAGEGAAQRESIVGVRQNPTGTRAEIGTFNDSQADYIRTRNNEFGGTPEYVRKYTRGTWEDLTGGKEYVDGPSNRNTADHLMVLQALLRAAAVRWGGTEWLTSGDSSNNSFASSLTANSQFVISVKLRQQCLRIPFGKIVVRALRHYLETHGKLTCKVRDDNGERTVEYPAELVLAVASVSITCPKAEAADPFQEAQKYEIECRNGANDPITWAQKIGNDPDMIQRNREKWREANPDMSSPLQLPADFGGVSDGQEK